MTTPVDQTQQQPGFVVPPAGDPPNLMGVPGNPPPPNQQAAAPTDIDSLIRLTQSLAAANAHKDEPAPSPAAEDGPDATSQALDAIGDPVLTGLHSAALALVPGLDVDRALGNAIEAGNAQYIDRAYLREIGKDKAERLIQIAEAAVLQVQNVTTQRASAIYAAAGGEQQWQAGVAAFNANASEAQRTLVKTMLNSGKNDLIMGAAQMVAEFARSNGFIANAHQGARPSAAPGAGQALSKPEFQAALAKLNPDAADYEQQREVLFGQRSLGRSLGR